MIHIDFQYDGRLDSLEPELREAIAAKLVELTAMLHQKVVDNVTGKILQKKTGQLAASIQQTTDTGGNPMVGSVFPAPQDSKAWVLEKGGAKTYIITAVRAKALHFFMKSGEERFAHSVMHPPSRAFGYLREAAFEMEPLVPEGFQEAIDRVLAMR